jgi:hypothetical protein
MQYIRIWADATGESHIDDVEMPTTSRVLVEGWPPFDFSAPFPVSALTVVHVPAGEHVGHDDIWHPAPRRQFLVYLQGETEITASDGARRRLGPGMLILVEDTTGKGHRSRALGGAGQVVLFIAAPESAAAS